MVFPSTMMKHRTELPPGGCSDEAVSCLRESAEEPPSPCRPRHGRQSGEVVSVVTLGCDLAESAPGPRDWEPNID